MKNKDLALKFGKMEIEYAKKSFQRLAAEQFILLAFFSANSSILPPLTTASEQFQRALKTNVQGCIEYFLSLLFVEEIAAFELCVFDFCRIILQLHPKKLGLKTTFSLDEILDLNSLRAIIDKAIDRHLNEISYSKPLDYLENICAILSFDKSDIESDWKVYIEAKARRDLGIHNGWICNELYLKKLKEADIKTEGIVLSASLLPKKEYIGEVSAATVRIVRFISIHCMKKFGKVNPEEVLISAGDEAFKEIVAIVQSIKRIDPRLDQNEHEHP